ncbi:hypothetical protein [Promicromonospora soli]
MRSLDHLVPAVVGGTIAIVAGADTGNRHVGRPVVDLGFVTDSAASLEDFTRWLGIVIAVVGALVANPEATGHAWGSFWGTVGQAIVWARTLLARIIPWLKAKPSGQHVVPGGIAGALPGLTGHMRGMVDWRKDATVEEKVAVLDQRTRAMDKELGELQQALTRTNERLRAELAEKVGELRRETEELRGDVRALESDRVKLDASALPIIVLGVLVTGIAPDAVRVQLWAWWLLLLLAVAITWWRVVAIVRAHRA